MKSNTTDIKEVRKVDPYTIEIETKGPFPILPDVITQLMIMSKKWCEENKAVTPVDRRKGIENTASFKANGTGPYRVRERQPNVRTVFTRNPTYWGKIEGNAQEVIFTPIANPATRVAALISGEVDVMEPVPVQDIARVNASPTARVISGPELRTIFLGMDQKRDELLYSSVKGKNPFKDKRVRQAFYQAIDIVGIQRTVMRGASRPTGADGRPRHQRLSEAQDKRLPLDVEGAKKLLAEAGYPNGFEVTMNCPNDRYVNDAQICQSVAANLAKIGVKINLVAETKGTYFPKMLRRDTSFYLLGWTPDHLRLAQRAHRADGLPRRQDRRRPVQPGRVLQPEGRRADQEDPVRDRQGQARRDDQGGLRPAHRRHRPPAAAPADAGLGREQEGVAHADGRQLHALQVDERQAVIPPAARMSVPDHGPASCGPIAFLTHDEKNTRPLVRQRRRLQLSHFAVAMWRRLIALRLRRLRVVRALGGAAQPLRPRPRWN
jgi:hypothetical protein